MEKIGGALLAKLPPFPMSVGALSRVESRLNESLQSASTAAVSAATPSPSATDDVAGLPQFMRRYPAGRWKWVAPGVHLRPIVLPDASRARVFLLKSGPGTKLLQHSHTGLEMTCVLAGAFTHEGGRFEPGDFDLGDNTVDHQPIVDLGEECVCLVAMQGGLRLNGIVGRLIQPFIRL
jgi:putative transcriptional regulator